MRETNRTCRIDPTELIDFALQLLTAAGMDAEIARVVAEVAVEGDMIGHSTHGVALVPGYMDDLREGRMAKVGAPEVISDRGACLTWNGNRLPGQWLIREAINQAVERVSNYGVVTCSIYNSQHTGALAAYLRAVTERGLVAILKSSNPAASRMAPFGGTVPLFTPNPLAAGFPTAGDPIVIDISCTITTTTMTQNLAARGERFPDAWAITAEGIPTDDPVEVTAGGGSLLPLGGLQTGHKGYGLALIVEMLTQGLSGYGRADAPESTAQSLFIQVIDPEFFGGRQAFERQSTWIAEACRSNPPAPGVENVRLPGDSAARNRRESLNRGVRITPEVVALLSSTATVHGIDLPNGLIASDTA